MWDHSGEAVLVEDQITEHTAVKQARLAITNVTNSINEVGMWGKILECK